MSIKSVTPDSAGRVISWIEGDYAFTVNRDSSGRPLLVRGTSPGRKSQVAEFNYNGTAFGGITGDIDTSMLGTLLAEAGRGGNVPVLRSPSDNTLPAQEKAAVLGASSAQATAFTSRALVAADNGGVFQTTTSQAVTINTGVTGFNGCVFYGPVTFAGTATLDDKRTTGADTDIAMVQRLTGSDSFRIIGGSV